MKFDLLVKNGHLLDPSTGHDGLADIAVRRGRVETIDASIPAEAAAQVHDASGQLVTPGLIDLHTHIYRGATFWGIDADAVAARTGVTTWVDAGSAGAFNLDGFREFIVEAAEVRIFAFLNISGIGLVANDYELTNLAYCDPALFELMADANRDLVVGGKVRLGTSTVGASGFEPLRLARQALDHCELPLMLHIARRPPEPEEFASLLRPGDVVTHCFTGQSMRLVDGEGRLQEFARDWVDRGVLLDIGHGISSFSFETTQAMIANGVKPHFISSDLHQISISGPAYDLPTCLAKLLDFGMTLPEVIACATSNPARFLGLERELGTLRLGAQADIAIFQVEDEATNFYDADWRCRPGSKMLRNTATFVGGRLLQRRPDRRPPRILDWRRGGRDEELYIRQAAARRPD